VLSAARPKIADYPFTTLVPNLGVVRRPSGDGTVFADIPGLIAGAAQGAGLGHDFLRHIERTRLLIHLIDASAEDVVADFQVVSRELEAYGHGLITRPRLVVLNKIELINEGELAERVGRLQALLDGPLGHQLSAERLRNTDRPDLPQPDQGESVLRQPDQTQVDGQPSQQRLLTISAASNRHLDQLLAAVWTRLGV